LSYTAIGEHVGMAQRMESVAPPGGVMLSESTAHLVEDHTLLGERELVHVKGVEGLILTRRLLQAPRPARRGHHRRLGADRPPVGTERYQGHLGTVDRRPRRRGRRRRTARPMIGGNPYSS
jgi:hypothetical protein